MPAIELERRTGRRSAIFGFGAVLRAWFVLLALLTVAACTSTGTSNPPGNIPATGTATAIDVHVADFKITPAQLEVRGPTVTLNVTNDGPTVHNVSVRDGSGNLLLHTNDLKPGESQTVSGQLPAGNLITFCSLPGHESLGTKGTIVVTRP